MPSTEVTKTRSKGTWSIRFGEILRENYAFYRIQPLENPSGNVVGQAIALCFFVQLHPVCSIGRLWRLENLCSAQF